MEDLKNLDFKSIIQMIIDFVMRILKFESNFDLGATDEETTEPTA